MFIGRQKPTRAFSSFLCLVWGSPRLPAAHFQSLEGELDVFRHRTWLIESLQ